MKKYRVLLLGIGFIGKQWIKTITSDVRCRLVAVSGVLPKGADVSSLGTGDDVGYFPDYREAIEKTEADFVVVAIPTRFHTDAARLALEKGMHVLSEKPLAVDDDDADVALGLVKDHPEKLYAVDQNYRWRPHNRTVKRLLDDGIVGDLREIHIEFRQPDDLNGYRADLEQPLLQDVCIHHIDLLRFFSGKVCREVYARSYHTPWSVFRGRASTDVLLEMDGGLYVTYSGTWAAHGKITTWDGDWTFCGEKGVLTMKNDLITFWPDGSEKGEAIPVDPFSPTELAGCLDNFINALDSGSALETPASDNAESFRIVCAAERAVASGDRVCPR